ncbi:MobA/MobL family protein [Rhodanobacter sp. AS-Z3]|uniref:MobA/MobL family protein n=1 Tax=Rhodanobacter sp. AS-Z3 TaxID=3031330 RepID=UPI00247ABB30|nr:MobA/MobL family protein [Rhodanobacter sp. AS-Z3]WEN15717.1 MobA/MobL family protein [Rhodanobacter sp. AS-Z3]
MASFHHQLKSGGKGKGAQQSDYIAGEGRHSSREDVIETGYGNMPNWVENDPWWFWKEADTYERKNGSVYHEHEITLPCELTLDQQIELASRHIADIAGIKPFQYAIHEKLSSLEGIVNTHLHLMVSDRMPDGIERSLEQMFRRYNPKYPERGGCRKDSGGMNRMELRDSVLGLKKQTAMVQNDALARYGHEARVDHRSLKEQGVNRQPERHLGPARVRKMPVEAKHEYVAARYARKNRSG